MGTARSLAPGRGLALDQGEDVEVVAEINLRRTPDPALGPGQGDQDPGPTDQDLKKTNQMKHLQINIMISFEFKKIDIGINVDIVCFIHKIVILNFFLL